jgi:hypothetical protein
MDTQSLSRQHRTIIDKAALLGGLCRQLRTHEEAAEARGLILDIDRHLLAHLEAEDAELYPILLNARDEGLRILGAEAFESIGGLKDIWVRFRDHWSVTAILADPRRFSAATDSLLGVVAIRIEMEEESVYPAAEAAARRGRRIDDAA